MHAINMIKSMYLTLTCQFSLIKVACSSDLLIFFLNLKKKSVPIFI